MELLSTPTPPRLGFLNGVYVAVDALSDVHLLVDGPYCVHTKAEMQYCHNLRSNLRPQLGLSRILQTSIDARVEEVEGLTLNRLAQVEAVFDELCGRGDVEAGIVTAFDSHQLLALRLA